MNNDREIYIYTEVEELEYFRKAGELAAKTLNATSELIKPGISTWDLDVFAETFIRDAGAIPTFKGYLGFPCTLCTSVNHEVVHGIPNKLKILKEGDILSIDVGVTLSIGKNGEVKNFVGDNAKTIGVGKINEKLISLMEDNKLALREGVKQCKAGNYISDIARAIENIAIEKKRGSIKDFGGHGIGPQYHAGPFIPNFVSYFNFVPDTKIEKGMILAIEPMFSLGLDEIRRMKDNWTIITKDNKPCCHFEYSVLITDDEPEILTKWD